MAVTFEDNWDEYTFVGTSDKMTAKYIISKLPNGYGFFGISMSKGPTAPDLQGSFTTPDKAKKVIQAYDAQKPMSQAAKNEFYAEERQKRKVNAETPAEAN